jgi:hypothetical protein
MSSSELPSREVLPYDSVDPFRYITIIIYGFPMVAWHNEKIRIRSWIMRLEDKVESELCSPEAEGVLTFTFLI